MPAIPAAKFWLSKLEIAGFKSFAGPATIKFSKTTNMIVGSRGMGKSNLVAAINWALGEEMPDVLFQGSATHGRANYAMVQLQFMKDSKESREKAKSISVTRYLSREGSLLLFLNKQLVTQKQLRAALKTMGIDNLVNFYVSTADLDGLLSRGSLRRRRVFEEVACTLKLRLELITIKQEYRQVKLNRARVLRIQRALEEDIQIHTLKSHAATVDNQLAYLLEIAEQGPDSREPEIDPILLRSQALCAAIINLREAIKNLGIMDANTESDIMQLMQMYDQHEAQLRDIGRHLRNLNTELQRQQVTYCTAFVRNVEGIQPGLREIASQLLPRHLICLEFSGSASLVSGGLSIYLVKDAIRHPVSLFSTQEKQLTALAVVIGLRLLQPAPFLALAGLPAFSDDESLARLGALLKSLSDKRQVIVTADLGKNIPSLSQVVEVRTDEEGLSSIRSAQSGDSGA